MDRSRLCGLMLVGALQVGCGGDPETADAATEQDASSAVDAPTSDAFTAGDVSGSDAFSLPDALVVRDSGPERA